MNRTLLFLLSVILAGGWFAPPARAHEAHDTRVTGVLGLDLYASGSVVDVLLAVQEKGAAGVELRHTRSRDGGRTWSAPVPILPGKAKVFAPRRGDDPQIASTGDRLVVLWTEPGSSPWGSGPLGSAISSDGGRTWTPGPRPADDGRSDAHGFADVAALGPERFLAVWLDSRSGTQGLRSSVTEDGGATWKKNVDVDARTCECCANRLLARAGSVDVIYRGRDPRDMVVATTLDGGATWTRRGPTTSFGWQFEGCPEVGGALAATRSAGRETLHALAWTGKESDVGVWRLTSADQGRTWSKPARIGDDTARQLDMASTGACVAAVWDEYRAAGKRSVVLASTSCDGGRTWGKPAIVSSAKASASHPLAAATADGVVTAWTERTDSGPVAWKTKVLPAGERAVSGGR